MRRILWTTLRSTMMWSYPETCTLMTNLVWPSRMKHHCHMCDSEVTCPEEQNTTQEWYV